MHKSIVCFWNDSNLNYSSKILSDLYFSAKTNRTSVPGQVRVSSLREALEVRGSLFCQNSLQEFDQRKIEDNAYASRLRTLPHLSEWGCE